MTDQARDYKHLVLRRPGVCIGCGTALPPGTAANWNAATRSVTCATCATPTGKTDSLSGTAGASARAIYEQRSRKREDAVRAAHPRIGGAVLALTAEPQHMRAWKSGAEGEERVAARLAKLASAEVAFLHDRALPHSRANIDHIAVGPSGVFVIDAKRYVNQKIEVRHSGGLFSARTESLYVGGRDKTALIVGVEKQATAVSKALALFVGGVNSIGVRAILCFLDADVPLLGTVVVRGVGCFAPRATGKRISVPGPYDAVQRATLLHHLAAVFPPAR